MSEVIDQKSRTLDMEAVAIVDPASAGKHLKEYVSRSGRKLIALITRDEQGLQDLPRPMTSEYLSRGCDLAFQSSSVDDMAIYLSTQPFKVVAIIAGSETGVEMADALAERFGLVGNSPDTSIQRRSKHAMRQACQRNKLAHPDFRLCSVEHEVIEFVEAHTLPVVVKTLKGAASVDVFICHTLKEVLNAFRHIVYGKSSFAPTTQVLVEEFLHGIQYWVDMLAVDGEVYAVGLVVCHLDAAGRFVQDDYLTGDQDQQQYSHIIQYALDAARATGLRWGFGFAELRDTPGKGPVLIEINSRLTGNDAPILLREISSMDPFQATLDTHVYGSNYRPKPISYRKHGTMLHLKTNVNGTVLRVDGLEDIKRLPSYVHHMQGKDEGMRVCATDEAVLLHMANVCAKQLERDLGIARHTLRVRVRRDSNI